MKVSAKVNNQIKRKQTLLAAAISLSLAIQVPGVMSLGLGAAQVKSQIGEPLLAEIPILDAKSHYDVNEILIRQVRGKLAQQLGFELAADSVGYFLKVVDRDGKLYLLVRSRRVMSEPFVSVLVELEWPNGKLYRDYNLLLDLAPIPVRAAVTSPNTSRSSMRVESPATESPRSESKTATARSRSNFQPVRQSAPTPAQTTGWRVGGGDTLSQIAQKIRPDDQIKLTAVVEAIFRLNPDAFAGGNINRMQGGSLLTLPSPNDFASMPRWDGRPGVAQAAKGLVSRNASNASTELDPAEDRVPTSSVTSAAPDQASQVVQGQYQEAGLSSSAKTPSSVNEKSAGSSSPRAIKPLDAYTVQSGDTLSQVAQRLRRDPSVKLQDMMQLLFAHNPKAFANGDINELQLGASLQVPPHGNARSVTRATIKQEPDEIPVVDQNLIINDKTQDSQQTEDSSAQELVALGAETAAVVSREEGTDARLTLSAQSNLSESSLNDDSSAKEILSQIDAVAELVDKVNRENQSIRQRIERIEHSEQLALLERLLQLQTRQIQNLREAMLAQQGAGLPGIESTAETSSQTDFASNDLKADETLQLGDKSGLTSAQLAVLESHLSPQTAANPQEAGLEPKAVPAASIETSTDNSSTPTETIAGAVPRPVDQKSSLWSVLWLAILVGLIGLVSFLFLNRRRQMFDWLNQKLNLFEQNNEEASLPRVWDPELGAWRVREEIRKPMLTPLATSLKDIEQGLAEHTAKQQAEAEGATENATESPVVDGSKTDHVEYPEALDFQLPESSAIDDMFEEIPDELDSSTLDEPACEDPFPLLEDEFLDSRSEDNTKVQNTADTDEEFVLDNLDGEFEFSLPDDIFDESSKTVADKSEKPLSTDDARVKASILQKTKDYNPDSIGDVLEGWLHSSIPEAEISEYEDVISEAMIYAAYGRHEHAEQLLLEQLSESPDEEKLTAALEEVQKSKTQFKSGQGFGGTETVAASFELPSAPEGLGELRLDLDDAPQKPSK